MEGEAGCGWEMVKSRGDRGDLCFENGLRASSASCYANVEWNPAPLCWTCWDAGKMTYTILHLLLRKEPAGKLAWKALCLVCWHGDAPAIPYAQLPLLVGEESAALGLWAGMGELCPVPCVERELLCCVQVLGARPCCTWWGPEGHCSILCPHRAALYPGASGAAPHIAACALRVLPQPVWGQPVPLHSLGDHAAWMTCCTPWRSRVSIGKEVGSTAPVAPRQGPHGRVSGLGTNAECSQSPLQALPQLCVEAEAFLAPQCAPSAQSYTYPHSEH